MGRHKVYRNANEDENFQRLRRERNIEYQHRYRQLQHAVQVLPHCNQNASNTVADHDSHDTVIQIPKQSVGQFSRPDLHLNNQFNIVVNQDSHDNLIDIPIRRTIDFRQLIPSELRLIDFEPLNTSNSQLNDAVDLYERQRRYRSRQTAQLRILHFDLDHIDEMCEHYIGKMDVSCEHCGAKHFSAERVAGKGNSFNDCCSHGSVALDALPNLPDELRELFDATHQNSKNFYERIRCYNSSFSFASFNANLVNFRNRRPGPYCFKIQGQIYYQVNTALYPAANEPPSYGQLFIVDPNEATEHRLNQNSKLDTNIVRILDRVMREFNIFAQSFQMMGEELENQRQLTEFNNESIPELQLLFTLKPGMDRRRYNFQRTNEVAAIFSTTADGEIPESYVTTRNRNTKILQSVSTMDPNVEPWVYPLFYPHGSQGWHRNLMRVNNNKRVSRTAYVKHRMAIRNEFNVFLMGRRLFQQWIVDNYVKIEKDRIQYCATHQTQLRADTYSGLIDHLQNSANNVNGRIGKIIILPSTFIGSPRNMIQNYQDAMAIVGKYGKPDLFVTMTCNPKWREIEEHLLPGQQASDRPDLCVRVFNLKKNYLLDLIVKQKCFGEVSAYLYVIEFQKRGLPHLHMLVTLKQNYKITTPEIVDRYILAEIPDRVINRDIHEIVMKNMIHGPCGDWCLVNGKCSKHFPKLFCEETLMDGDGYPYYWRRDTGVSYERPGGYIVDNRHVVPYCPMLLILFNCHINVEIVSSMKSVKYLYKYIYKGHDAAVVTVGETSPGAVVDHDEIKDYIEARYVSPPEACWRILSKPLHDKSHSIIRLPVHLPNEQNLTVHVDATEDLMMNVLEQVTMLMEYFSLNARDEQAKKYLYTEIPSHYTFKKQKVDGKNVSRWEKRKSHYNCVGRMYSVSPTQVELFHLRLLLLTVRGATSFDDVRTVNGELLQTFSATCLALGLVEDDEEWRRAMNEGEVWMMPSQLRRLFVRILIHCQPVHPQQLWEEFKVAMSEDYTQHMDLFQANKKAYSQISAILRAEGKTLADFPELEQFVAFEENDGSMCFQQAAKMGNEHYAKLNEEQKYVTDAILSAVDNENYAGRNCFYIDGPGGSGKTFVYTTLWYVLKGRKKRVSIMAFTGIAATLLPNGKTVHKTFGLPVPLFADSSSNIKIQSNESKYLQETDVFIWDEAPMAPRYALEVMDRTLRDITNTNLPFGGKIVVLGGDFRQLLPVLAHSTRCETVNLSVKFSTLWVHFEKLTLTQNVRALPQESEFIKFLLDVGDGILNDCDNNMEIPQCCVAPANADIVYETYGDLIHQRKYKEAANCAILSARNADLDEINKRVVELLDVCSERIYTSIDSAENCANTGDISEALLPEYLNSLSPPSLPPYQLRLRLNSVVMLIRNLSIHEGLCNGTRLLVLELGNNLLRCEILTGDKAGEIVFLNRITLYCESVYPFTFKRRQFPIKLAFAMTINKSQGQTFARIGIDLRKDVFNHGQLYVACSRVRSWKSLKIFLGSQRDNMIVKNYVYKELLSLPK